MNVPFCLWEFCSLKFMKEVCFGLFDIYANTNILLFRFCSFSILMNGTKKKKKPYNKSLYPEKSSKQPKKHLESDRTASGFTGCLTY